MDVLQDLIYPAVDNIAPTLKDPGLLKKSPETPLWGAGAALDSLGLVTFIVEVEGRIATQTGQSLTLANEKALSQKNSPFRTLGTLAAYITDCLKDAEPLESDHA